MKIELLRILCYAQYLLLQTVYICILIQVSLEKTTCGENVYQKQVQFQIKNKQKVESRVRKRDRNTGYLGIKTTYKQRN